MLSVLRERFMATIGKWKCSTRGIWAHKDKRQYGFDWDTRSDSKGAHRRCGYDQTGLPVLLQHLHGADAPDQEVPRGNSTSDIWAEEFLTHHRDSVDVSRFVRGELERVSRLTFRDGLLIEEYEVVRGVYRHTRWEYQAGRVVLQQSISDKGRAFFEITYGPHGEQTYFRVRRDGTRFQLYQPRPKGLTVKSLKETVRSRIVALVPELVSAAHISEPIYCVALAYDNEGNDALPPAIGIGLESERQCWKAEHGKKAKDFIWNPAEFQHYEKPHTQISDEVLEEACDNLNSKWTEGNPAAPAGRLLIEIAAELTQLDWPDSVQRTADFVVYAVGLEGSGLRKSLKASLSQEKLALLKAEGLY